MGRDRRRRDHSYDLRCSTSDDQRLYVEVKGTTGPLGAVVLTANEVALARSLYPATALFVVHRIELEGGSDDPIAVGGEVFTARPWTPVEERLIPTVYRYSLLEGRA